MGLVGAWGFHENSGSVAADSSGSGLQMTAIPGWTNNGHAGSAMAISGSAGGQVTVDSKYRMHGESTFMCWLYLDSFGAASKQILHGPRFGSSGIWSVEVSPTGVLSARHQDDAVIGSILELGTWHHITYAVDWAEGGHNRKATLYVDGVQVGQSIDGGAGYPMNSGTVTWGGTAGNNISGQIDDARWFDHELSLTEIQSYMGHPVRPPKNRFLKNSSGAWVRMNTKSMFTLPPPEGLMGWQLNASNTGLARHGIDGKSLPIYNGPSAPAAGTRIYGKRILTALDLSAGDIVIEKCLIEPMSSIAMSFLITAVGREQDKTPAILPTIKDCTISGDMMPTGPNPDHPEDGDGYYPASVCAIYGLCNVYDSQIFNVGSGIATLAGNRQSSCEVQSNYVHSLKSWGPGATYGNHCDGYTVRVFRVDENPLRTLTVSGNRIDATTNNETGAFFIQPINGHIGNVIIEDNYLEGNNWNLCAGDHSGNSYSNIRVIDNRFRNPSSLWHFTEGGPGWAEFTENYTFHPTNPDNKGNPL